MSDKYSVLVDDADQNEKEIKDLQSVGFEKYQLPDNQVLMVHNDAPDEIKNAALDAGNGDYEALRLALGITEE
jgi:Ni,Fe-hydrogenase III component G